MHRARRTRGFTIVEILVAVIITSVGFAAIFSMQIGSMQGNIEAREMAAATNLAERFAAQLRRNAYMWTAGERPDPGTNPFLGRGSGIWHSLTPDPVDHNGRAHIDDDGEFGSSLARQRFCVHYWLGARNARLDGVLNMRVRVVWPLASLDRGTLTEVCPENRADAFEDDPTKFRSVVLPAAIRRHET